MRILRTVGTAAALLLLLSCGGGKQASVLSGQSPDWMTAVSPAGAGLPVTLQGAVPLQRNDQPREIALDEALAELDALETPTGVDGVLFSQLKEALREALRNTWTTGLPPVGTGETPVLQGKQGKLVSTPPTGEANRVEDLELINNGDGTYTLTWSYRNCGDYNQDGIVNIMDITPLAVHFNETAGETNEWIDGNADTVINIMDITPLAANFLTECAGYSIRGASTHPASLAETSEVETANFSLASGEGRKRFNVQVPESAFGYIAVAPFDSAREFGELSNIVEMPNQPPVADLVADKTAGDVPLLVHFDASASYDRDGSIVEFKWNFDGDATYDDTTPEPTNSHLYESGGDYNATVRVTDDEGAWDTAYVTIRANQPPVAVLAAEPMEGPAPLTVNFDASDSSDEDGEIVSYEWDFDADGVYEYDSEGDSTVDHTYEAYGSYQAALQVTDDDGAQSTDSVTIEVNRQPVAQLSATPTEGAIPLEVSFDAGASYDPDGTIVQYEWDFDGDSTYDDTTTEPVNAHTYGRFGSFDAVVRVTDDDGATDSDSVQVTVEGWAHTWGAEDDDKAYGVCVDSSQNLYVAGRSSSFEPSADVLLLKYNAQGELAFSETWGGDDIDSAQAVAVDSSQDIYVAGYTRSFGAGRSDVFLLKFGPNGNMLWQKTWGGENDDRAYALAVDSLGNVYVAGYTDNPDWGRNNVLVLKYDALGSLLWEEIWGGTEPEEARAVFVDDLGNIYVTGSTSSFNDYQNVFLLKLNSDGELLFDRSWGTHSLEETGYAVLADSSGNIYLTGYTKSFGAGASDVLLLKFDSSGDPLWQRTWGGIKDETAYALLTDSLENIYVAGYTSSFGAGNHDVLLLKYDSTGELVFSQTWGGGDDDEDYALVIADDGNVYIGGLAPNAFGSARSVTGGSSSPGGSVSTPGGLTGPAIGEEAIPEGTVTEREGVEDEGGDYADVLLIKYIP